MTINQSSIARFKNILKEYYAIKRGENLLEFLRGVKIEDLGLPDQISQKLRDQNLTEFQKIYVSIQSYRAFGKSSIKELTDEEMQILDQKNTDLLVANGLINPKDLPVRSVIEATSSLLPPVNQTATPNNTRQAASIIRPVQEEIRPGNELTAQPAKRSVHKTTPSQILSSPLCDWENRFLPQLKKYELVGEILISKEELDEISLHFSHLFDTRSEHTVFSVIERYFPATFLVFMVGQGIHGYNGGDFWQAYEQSLRKPINHTDFGRLFEKLLKRFGKPQFRDLQERSMRYVSLILAHGGIPVYCLKDFFSNIVLNCAIRPQLFALDGEELVEEVLKHITYTANTDKPVLHFLEYGGSTAANLLDRSRKMLLTWQQNQTLLSAEDAGLPAHLIQYFAEWTRENVTLTLERESRNRLKRPQLALDPWGLGIFLRLPSQHVSALSMSDVYWKVDAGDYHEEIKARTQRKGDQIETREITLRLNEVSETITVRFSQGEDDFDWPPIIGYSPDHLILAFDPITGQLQNHILARETWLVYPHKFTLSILTGEGNMLEVLPDLPGEWSKLNLECWDLTQTVRLGLSQNNEVFRDVFVRSQEKVLQPSLDGGRIVPTNFEENPMPVYAGSPPVLRIPLTHSDDLQAELSRWQIRVESIGTAAPEISFQKTLVDLPETVCTVLDNIAGIPLGTPQILDSRPTGTYQISIKGPLGRDATLSLQILPECEVTDLKELYIPDRGRGPEDVSFSIQTSLLDGVDSLNGADGIKVKTEKSGLHHVLVPADISSVGLLIRRETVNHQFVRVPIYFRIKRLRWRLVGDNDLVENWLQKYSTLSVQELLQEESPLLIVDLPGNDGGVLSLQLNLSDIQGNIIQQLKPADRSVKRVNRFWRFDLSKIKHMMEMNDSPIFRLDLIGIKDSKGEEEFGLPVLVFTQDIQITQLSSEVHSSSEQHSILATWEEKKQLRSRALILWSLFRPWQPPIIENIPDAACGEYEFSVSNNEHVEGLYRMQMVVVDPWVPLLPPPLPPVAGSPGCHDVELSSPHDRLKKLEREIAATNSRKTTQFNNRIEISLIRQYFGEMEASRLDLEACCHNLQPATSREILTLMSILSLTNSTNLETEFGDQIILPEILGRLYKDMSAGEISFSDFTSILKLAPHSKNWPVQTCETLVQLEDPKIRFRALVQLVTKDIAKAVIWIITLLQQSRLSLEDAVELLYEEKPTAIEQLKKIKSDPIAEQLLELMSRYNPYSGLPVLRAGSWVLTNAGWGRIDEILDPSTRISVDSFLEGHGKYILSVTMNIYESYDLTGEKALINMVKGEITFPRANRIFICQHCQEFATAKREMFKTHMITSHGNALMYPGERTNVVRLASIQFNMNPQQKKMEL